MERVVHLVWPVGPALTVMERLNLSLWLRHGFTPHLWSYDHGHTADAPAGVVKRDAREILPESSLFRFESPHGFIPGKGIGSLAHWSDQFQLALLNRHGGWYAQLDVSCLRPPLSEREYYFAPFGSGDVQTCLMKGPAGQAWMRLALEDLSRSINAETRRTIRWCDSMACISRHVRAAGLGPFIGGGILLEDDVAPRYMLGSDRPRPDVHFLHWSNAASGSHKTNPRRATFYYDLLVAAGLATGSPPCAGGRPG